MKRTIETQLVDSDVALNIIGMQPKDTTSLRAWQRRRPLLHNTGLKAHPRGNVVRWERKECEQLRRDLDSGRKAISTQGHVITLDNSKAA